MIRKVLLSTVAIAAISGTAFAADLPSRRAPPVYIPPPVPVFSWTGFYVGGQVGYEFGPDRSVLYPEFGGAAPVAFDVGSTSSVIGGGHVGYNFSTQSLPLFGGVAGGLLGTGGVIGIEGDVDGSNNNTTQLLAGGLFAENHKSNIEGSIRGRLGIAVDRALFYVTGGAAFAEFHDAYSTVFFGTDAESRTRVGWTVGGGVEYAITPTFSLRAEYRYSDFGTYNVGPLNTAFLGTFGAIQRPIEERAQLGFSYKFDNPVPAPVVARY